jgi:hypothetical protein
LFFIGLIIALLYIEVQYYGAYLDEIIAILAGFYLLFSPKKKLLRSDAITLIIMFSVIVIGVVSNILFGVVPKVFPIMVDIIAETKIMLFFYATKYFLSDKEKQQVIDVLTPLAQIYFIFAFMISIYAQFRSTRFTYGVRYGIEAFRFIFKFPVVYVSVSMLFFCVIVCTSTLTEKIKRNFYFIGLISLLMATKGPPIIFTILFLVLYRYFKKRRYIKISMLIPLTIIILIASTFQINEYLISDSVRFKFTQYAVVTANHYFPLGSGFASYGSDMAARYYSQLYYQYGFDNILGMSPSTNYYLNDNFWQMAIGQFGYFGAILYGIIFVRIFLSLNRKDFSNSKRAYLYAAFFQYMIQAIGGAILSSSYGMIGFAGIALLTVIDPDKENQTARLPSFKIKI